MRKTRSPMHIRTVALILAVALLVPLCTSPAYAWSELLQTNAVSVSIGDTEVIRADESIEIVSDEETYTVPASLLLGEVLYLPLVILQELGLEFTVDTEAALFTVEPVDRLTVGEDSAFSHIEEAASALNETEVLTNQFSIVVAGEVVAEMGKNLTYHDVETPSSMTLSVGIVYLPVQPIFQALRIDTSWDETRSALLISDSAAEERSVGLSNFQKINRYSYRQFADVPSSAWYAASVKAAYEYGLMNGAGDAAFNPSGNISVAETVTIASRLHNVYYGSTGDFQPGTPWYQVYVDYALENQIIAEPYTDYSAPISRSEFAVIIGNVFPLEPINAVEDGAIPDVADESDCYEAVYSLYRAGVLSGADAIGSFKPEAEITRAEAATILCSMVDETLRKEFTLKKPILPSSIQVTPASVLVPTESTHTLSASIQPGNADRDTAVTWASSDPAVAAVSSSGVVSGVSAGTAVITATTANGKSASCKVTVEALEDTDIRFARDAVNRVYNQLKFPDTLQIHGIWAFSYFSEKDIRTVYIDDEAVRLLVEDRKNHPFSQYLFPSPVTGGMYGPDCVARMHKKLLEKAGIEEHVRFHDLRRTFATMALQNGVDPKTISRMLGHYSAEFTLDVYANVTRDMQKEAAQKIGGYMAAVV